MQHDFVDTNFGQSCSNIGILFMFNCQTKRTIVALFIYPETPPRRVFFAQFPHNRCLLPHNLPPKTRTIFFFFLHPVRRPVLYSHILLYCAFNFLKYFFSCWFVHFSSFHCSLPCLFQLLYFLHLVS